jgi:hypothetical protein
LELAVSDGGVIEVGGPDGRKVRADVLDALCQAGMLDYDYGGVLHISRTYRLTDIGRAALQQSGREL